MVRPNQSRTSGSDTSAGAPSIQSYSLMWEPAEMPEPEPEPEPESEPEPGSRWETYAPSRLASNRGDAMPSRSEASRNAASRRTCSSSQPKRSSLTAHEDPDPDPEPSPDSFQICPSAPRVTGVNVQGPAPSA